MPYDPLTNRMICEACWNGNHRVCGGFANDGTECKCLHRERKANVNKSRKKRVADVKAGAAK